MEDLLFLKPQWLGTSLVEANNLARRPEDKVVPCRSWLSSAQKCRLRLCNDVFFLLTDKVTTLELEGCCLSSGVYAISDHSFADFADPTTVN